MSIPINIQDLLSAKVVEGERIELKKGWNPKTVMRSVCAFANDFFNQGSGYIVPAIDSDLANQLIKDPYNFEFLTLTKGFREKALGGNE